MGKKPTTHIVDANREELPGDAKFSLCGAFLYKSEQVNNADPSCQKCRWIATRRAKRPPTKTRRLATKAS